ncbi:putative protein kinase C delta type homolog isoform X2 [Contarinia nasturtii]|uniref:putative protein kinase C delta type homolog isoform X2 n=1 Tax=Contarinia nasturtii TaxID=265458 RepID=UPI0012D49A00|nr:putative protein kinase C delta type homolog isoform X2 [Contarinia nasturtii]
MGLKRRHQKKKHQQFDPQKAVKLDHKRKCYINDEPPRYPLIATPRQLQKRFHYYSESESEIEEINSEDESNTEYIESSTAEAKDLICMSSSCNDSGFKSGGTAPANQKNMLETSFTYAQYLAQHQTGKITPPATTLPHFKNYTVNDFHFLAVLGTGAFGKVYLAEICNTEYYYAVKCLKKDVLIRDDNVDCTFTERKVLTLGTHHPYLCHLYSTFQTENHLFFVMDYLIGGDLMFHIQVNGRFSESQAKFFGAEIVSGLKFLHKKGIIYRDLKLDNILLDFDGHVRICDFGLCKLDIYLDRTAESFCGTPDYISPEIIMGQKYNQSTDWWSFGVLLYEMLVGQSPFSGCDEDALFWSICNEIPWYPFYISDYALNILGKLLDKKTNTRLGSPTSPHGEITENVFFHEIDWKKLERRQLESPFKPEIKHPLDTHYFDRAYTREKVRLPSIIDQIKPWDQEKFKEFSYTNPNVS